MVDTIRVRMLESVDEDLVDEDLVGMRPRMKDLESLLDIGSNGVRMVGIWGIGGSGKTTLATSLCMEISRHFQGYCIVENVREKSSKYGFKKLQKNILSVLLGNEVEVESVVEGMSMMKSMLCRRKVLVLLDDVDKLGQLESLVGKHNWFGSGSRIIITTRDEHLLRTHKVDEVCRVRLLSHEEAIRLFNRHAFNEKDPVEDYETLSLRVISYAAGLPLALKVLGCLLYDKKEWMSYLARLKDIPEVEIIEKLKLSYDGLKAIEKELFLDIACFFNRQTSIDYAMEVFEACGYHPKIGIEVLRQKALITIEHSSVLGDVFNMHDLVIEMAHHIVRGEHPNNLEKHSRVWNDREIDEMCFGDATMVNCKIEAIVYSCFSYDESSRFCTNVSNMKKLRWLNVYMNTEGEDADEDVDGGPTFLSNELHYIDWNGYIARPFPDGFRPMKLVVLKLWGSRQIELWKGCKRLPLLKVLRLIHMYKLLSTPDFDGLPSLQKLTLIHCDELREIHPSLENHKSLEYVTVLYCPKLLEVPRVPSSLAILKTDCCKSLTTIDKNCKWLR